MKSRSFFALCVASLMVYFIPVGHSSDTVAIVCAVYGSTALVILTLPEKRP